MARMPYMPFYPDDYLSSPDVSTWDLVNEAIYIRLLLFQWKHPGCQLPNNIQYLRRLCKNQASEARIKEVLDKKFDLVDPCGKPVDNLLTTCGEQEDKEMFWRNSRLYFEFNRSLNKSQTASDSANARHVADKAKLLERHKTAHTNASEMQLRNTCDAVPTRTRTITKEEKKRPTRQSIAKEQAEEAWTSLLADVKKHIDTGCRLVISNKPAREVMYKIGGTTRLRLEIDKPEYLKDFMNNFVEKSIHEYEQKKS